MEKTTVAFIYDFDETLCNGHSEFAAIKDLFGYKTEKEWFTDANSFADKFNMDSILGNFLLIKNKAEEKNIRLTQKLFSSYGKDVKLNKGLDTWFDRMNAFAQNLGLNLEHYILSSGIKPIIDNVSIAKNFKRIFASDFLYDKEQGAFWPAITINYANKTQFISRIRKEKIDRLSDLGDVNVLMKEDEVLPYEHMVYFGDGLTDVPCMKILKLSGGTAISVYKENDEKSYNASKRLYLDRRVNYYAPADYSENKSLERISMHILNKIKSYLE